MPICFLCSQEGHIKHVCPKNIVKLSQVCCVPRTNAVPGKSGLSLKMITIEISGKELQDLLHRQFVSPAMINPSDKKLICCVHGDEKLLPTVDL